MRHLTLVTLVALACLTPAIAPAQAQDPPNWSLEAYFAGPKWAPAIVVANKFGELTGLVGHKDWSLDLKAFAGKSVNESVLGGVEVGKNWRIADQLSVWTGLGVTAREGAPVGFGFSVGLAYTSRF